MTKEKHIAKSKEKQATSQKTYLPHNQYYIHRKKQKKSEHSDGKWTKNDTALPTLTDLKF